MIGNGYDPFKSPELKNYFGSNSSGGGEVYNGYNPQFGMATAPATPIAPDGSVYENPYDSTGPEGSNGGGSASNTPGNHAELTDPESQDHTTNGSGLPGFSLGRKGLKAASLGASMLGGPLASLAVNGLGSYSQMSEQDDMLSDLGYQPNVSYLSTLGNNLSMGIFGRSAQDQAIDQIDTELAAGLHPASKEFAHLAKPKAAPVALPPTHPATPVGPGWSGDYSGPTGAAPAGYGPDTAATNADPSSVDWGGWL
jgi:hypothetical protein